MPSVLSPEQEARAARLHAGNLVIDALNTPYAPMVPNFEAVCDHVRRGGVNAVHVTLHERSADGWGWASVIRAFSVWLERCHNHPGAIHLATRAGDIRQAGEDGRLALLCGIQNGVCIDDDLERLLTLWRLGVRVVQLTYNTRNQIGDGCREVSDQGLSAFGRDAVRRMNEVGLAIDLSHCSPKTTMDSVRISGVPVTATHVGARALYPHPRNKTDDELRAIADSGGVIGVIGVPLFLRREGPDSIDDMFEHMEYIADLVGIDRVGVGHDNFVHPNADHFRANDRIGFATGTEGLEKLMPADELPSPERWSSYHQARLAGFAGIAEWPNWTRGLVARGYTDAEIEGVLGQNWLRLFASLWDDADSGDTA